MLLPDPLLALGQFAETHQPVRACPNGNLGVEHTMLVPRGWLTATSGELPAPQVGEPSLIGYYREPIDTPDAATITVTMLHIPFEIGLAAWLRYDAAAQGRMVFHQATLAEPSPRVELGQWLGDGTERRMMRTHALVDQGRVFAVTAEASAVRWPALASVLSLPGFSFELASPTGVERHEAWTQLAEGRATYRVPASWKAEPALGSFLGLRLAGSLRGLLRVILHPPGTSSPARFAHQVQALAGFGIEVGGAQWIADASCDALDGWQGSGRARGRQPAAELEVEVHLGYRELEGCPVSIMVVGPPLEEAPVSWMRARRAFEIVAETLEVS